MAALTPRQMGAGSSFGCPKCKGDTGVKDSRPNRERTTIRRRRECFSCGYRYSTFELEIPDGISPVGLAHLVRETSRALNMVEKVIQEARANLDRVDSAHRLIYGDQSEQ